MCIFAYGYVYVNILKHYIHVYTYIYNYISCRPGMWPPLYSHDLTRLILHNNFETLMVFVDAPGLEVFILCRLPVPMLVAPNDILIHFTQG